MSIPLKIKSSFIDPFWLNKVAGGIHLSIVNEDSSIELAGKTLLFADSENILPPGTTVRIWMTRNFECESLASYQSRKAAREEIDKQRREKERLAANERRDKAIAFNDTIHLPVPWEPAIKDVLSGLSATSWGDGRNRSSVQHIRILEDLHLGKLIRMAWDFLCTSATGSNGKAYCNSHKEEFVDGDGLRYDAPVSCKACLKLSERWQRKNYND